jgi:hypothetical protein
MKQALKYGVIAGLGAWLLCFPSLLRAQEKFPCWEFKIFGGFNIGGTSPLPLPEEIRSIDVFTPAWLAPHASLEVIRRLNRKWGIAVQLGLDHKGFTVTDRVKSLHTEIEMNDEVYSGNFTGKNTTRIRNSYITLPVTATYRIDRRWELHAGAYLAYLYGADFKGEASDGYIRQGSPIGEKTIVDRAVFDFSDKQKSFDYGLLLAGEWTFYSRFACRGQIAWGLCPLFPSNFTGVPVNMYNIYGGLGITYRLN